MNTKYIRFFKSSNEFECILILLGLTYLLLLPFAVLIFFFPVFELGTNPVVDNSSTYTSLIIKTVILAPLLETFINQWLPIKLLRNKLKLSVNKVCITSAVIFSALHYYSMGYIIFTFIIGYILVYGYIILQNTNKSAFRVIWLTHSLRNLIALVFIEFLQ